MKKLFLLIPIIATIFLLALFNREEQADSVSSSDYSPQTFTDYLDTQQIDKNNLSAVSQELEKFIVANITDETIQKFHESDDNKFEIQTAHLAHILFRTDNKMDALKRKEKYDKAYQAYQALKSGADFAQLSHEYSEDYLTSKKGGDLGWINKGDINAEFDRYAFNYLKPGEISKPFQSKFGFHIVKLIEARKLAKKPLEEVKHLIRANLENKYRQEHDQIIGLNTASVYP